MAGDAVVLGRGHLDLGDDGQRRATGRRGDASVGEASMAHFAPLLFTPLSLSPAQRRLRYGPYPIRWTAFKA